MPLDLHWRQKWILLGWRDLNEKVKRGECTLSSSITYLIIHWLQEITRVTLSIIYEICMARLNFITFAPNNLEVAAAGNIAIIYITPDSLFGSVFCTGLYVYIECTWFQIYKYMIIILDIYVSTYKKYKSYFASYKNVLYLKQKKLKLKFGNYD